MHGLIFETSVWLLAESTRLLSSQKECPTCYKNNTTPALKGQTSYRIHAKSTFLQTWSFTMLSLNISKPSNEDVITTFDSFTCQLKTHRTNINNDNNYVTLLHFAQWSCWGQFERTQELTAHKLRMHTKLSSIHTFWTTNLLSCAAKSDHVKLKLSSTITFSALH